MTDEHDHEQLDGWEALAPPKNFADRVLAAKRKQDARQTLTPRLRAWFASAAAVVLVVIGAALWLRAPFADDGDFSATTRTTLNLGTRAVVVAEADSQLAWHVSNTGHAEVEQRYGQAFYRVEPGGAFVVKTPAGQVTVTGTCFSVEVDMKGLKPAIIGAVMGAAVSSAATVTVYEGRVAVENERGQVALTAGEHASMSSGSAPSKRDGASFTALAPPMVVLAAQKQAAESDAAAARAEIVALKEQLEQARKPQPVTLRDALTKGRVDPSPEQLAEMAKNCEVRVDLPPVLGAQAAPELSDKTAASYGVSSDERATFDQVVAQFQTESNAQLNAFYKEITGNAASSSMSSTAMMELITGTLGAQESIARQTIAREHAGLAQPPADLASAQVADRYERWFSTLGDAFESELAAKLGAARAHALRAANDGWMGSSHSSSGCPDAGAGAPE